MPSPLGHSLGGLLVGLSIKKNFSDKFLIHLACIFHANAADLDFIPGILLGDPNRFHHNQTHSIGFALAFCAITAIVYAKWRKINFIPVYTVFTFSFFTHLLFDYLGKDLSEPRGIPLFWPLISEYFVSPISIFMDISHGKVGEQTSSFLSKVFSSHNAVAMISELIIVLFFFIFIQLLIKLKKIIYKTYIS